VDNRSHAVRRLLNPTTVILELAGATPGDLAIAAAAAEHGGSDDPSDAHPDGAAAAAAASTSRSPPPPTEADIERFVKSVGYKRAAAAARGLDLGGGGGMTPPGAQAGGRDDAGTPDPGGAAGGGGGPPPRRSGSTAKAAEAAEAAVLETAMRRLVCPLTGRLLRQPVVAADGVSYSRAALEAWLAAGHTESPVTREPLASAAAYPNATLQGLMQDLGLA